MIDPSGLAGENVWMPPVATAWGTDIAIEVGLAHEVATDLLTLKKAKPKNIRNFSLRIAHVICEIMRQALQ